MDLIFIDNRIAEITKKHSEFSWRLKFKDNNEIVNVFYHKEEKWCLIK